MFAERKGWASFMQDEETLWVLDVGVAAAFVCQKVQLAHGLRCKPLTLGREDTGGRKVCREANAMRDSVRAALAAHEWVATACVTCASVLEDPAPFIGPLCALLKGLAGRGVIFLSTTLSAQKRVHEAACGMEIRYITMDELLEAAESGDRDAVLRSLEKLDGCGFAQELQTASTVVLGCSHFCMYTAEITDFLRGRGFGGEVVDVVDVFVRSLARSPSRTLPR